MDIFPFFGGISTILSSGIGAKASEYAADRQLEATRQTNEMNLQLAREQNDWNWNAMLYNNNWNSTASQLQRWKDAGLNPNSFAGVASPVAATAPQSANLANQVAPEIGNILARKGDYYMQGINGGLDLILRAKKLNLESKKTDAEIINLDANSEFVRKQVDDLLPQTIRESQSRSKLNEETVVSIRKNYAKLAAEIDNIYANTNLADTKSSEIKTNVKFLRETWDDRKISLSLANMLSRSELNINHQTALNLSEQLKGIIIDNGLKGNEYVMTEVSNWVKKVTALSDTFKTMSDLQKSNYFSSLFNHMSSILDVLTSGEIFDSSDRAKSRQKFHNDFLRSIPSIINPVFK